MSMSVNLHCNNVKKFESRGYVTTNSMSSEPYAVVTISSNDGNESQDMTLFLNAKQVHELKLTLCKTDKAFERYITQMELEKEVNK